MVTLYKREKNNEIWSIFVYVQLLYDPTYANANISDNKASKTG
jgi:hypothetical protein